MYAKVTVVGHLGRRPELRYTPDGTAVCNFSVATNKTWKDANGESQKRTTWYRVTCWRKLAEVCAQYLDKGRPVLVIGEMQEPRVYQGRDGESRCNLEVTADDVRFLGGRREEGGGEDERPAARRPEPMGAPAGTPDLDDVEEIPF